MRVIRTVNKQMRVTRTINKKKKSRDIGMSLELFIYLELQKSKQMSGFKWSTCTSKNKMHFVL